MEINEAFAAQVLGCQKALRSKLYEQLSIDNTFGEIDSEILNVAGGAIALGHPVAASGPRILLNIIHLLKNKKLKTGMVSICIGGGMGGAAILNYVDRQLKNLKLKNWSAVLNEDEIVGLNWIRFKSTNTSQKRRIRKNFSVFEKELQES